MVASSPLKEPIILAFSFVVIGDRILDHVLYAREPQTLQSYITMDVRR